MAVIYKRQDRKVLFENMVDHAGIATKRNLVVGRCIKCKMLFQTFRTYTKQWCALCRYEQNDAYKQACIETARVKGLSFDERDFYESKLRAHIELQSKKDHLNEALKVKVTNQPICSRTL